MIRNFRNRTLMVAGMCAIAIRSVLQTMLDRKGLTTDVTDFALGALMGVGVALLLLAISGYGRDGRSRCVRD